MPSPLLTRMSLEVRKRDPAAAAPMLRPGGTLVFNDFAHADPFPGADGVHRAAVEFATGLNDLALRRPT